MDFQNIGTAYRMLRDATAFGEEVRALQVTRENIDQYPELLAQRQEMEERGKQLNEGMSKLELIIGAGLAFARSPRATGRAQQYINAYVRSTPPTCPL